MMMELRLVSDDSVYVRRSEYGIVDKVYVNVVMKVINIVKSDYVKLKYQMLEINLLQVDTGKKELLV